MLIFAFAPFILPKQTFKQEIIIMNKQEKEKKNVDLAGKEISLILEKYSVALEPRAIMTRQGINMEIILLPVPQATGQEEVKEAVN